MRQPIVSKKSDLKCATSSPGQGRRRNSSGRDCGYSTTAIWRHLASTSGRNEVLEVPVMKSRSLPHTAEQSNNTVKLPSPMIEDHTKSLGQEEAIKAARSIICSFPWLTLACTARRGDSMARLVATLHAPKHTAKASAVFHGTVSTSYRVP